MGNERQSFTVSKPQCSRCSVYQIEKKKNAINKHSIIEDDAHVNIEGEKKTSTKQVIYHACHRNESIFTLT